MQAIRKGNYPVVATNHTLILNWNSQTVPLLRQIAINKKEQAGAAYAGYASLTHTVTVTYTPTPPHTYTTYKPVRTYLHIYTPGVCIQLVACQL